MYQTERNSNGYFRSNQKSVSPIYQKQKNIADYLTANPGDICYITLAQLSQKTSSSELTLLRFCQKVGCESFLDLKNEFRGYTQHMIKQVSAPAYFVPDHTSGTTSQKQSLILDICKLEAVAAADFFSNINVEHITSVAGAIKKSKRIFIFAHDISKIPGEFLVSRLKLLYLNASLVDLEDISGTQQQLEELTENDMVIFFSFPKYYFPLESIAKKAAEAGAVILTIADSISSPAANFSHYLLLCQTTTKIFYNSLTLPVALVNLLVSYLAVDVMPPARRQDFIDTLSS